jgi:hypothetical protein
MTCHDAREWLSALVDEEIDAARRAEVEAHLAGCPECRLELEGLRATVGMLRRVETPRAPLGFVDRIVERARPTPWYRRAARWLFVPLAIKIPAQAAALLLVAGLAVFLFERTPELRDASRMESSPGARPEAPQASTPAPHAPVDVPPSRTSAQAPAPAGPGAPPPAEREARDAVASAPSSPMAPSTPAPAAREETTSLAAPPPPASAPSATPPSRGNVERQKRATSQALRSAAAAARPPIDLAGRLVAKDRDAAIASLGDLLAHLGGRELGRRQEGTETVIDVEVPRSRYEDLVRGLQALGSWLPEGPGGDEPPPFAEVRVSIRIP